MEPVALDLIGAFPDIDMLDVSPRDSVAALDRILTARGRKMRLVLQAIELIPDTYEETFRRLNSCIALARAVLAG